MNSIVKAFIITTFIFPGYCLAQQHESYIDSLLDKHYTSSAGKKVYIQTDKYLYKTGEKIWITGLVLDRRTHRKVAGRDTVQISLEHRTNNELISTGIFALDGQVKGGIKLPEDLEDGRYLFTAKLARKGTEVFQKEVLIKKQVIPSFIVEVIYPAKVYDDGDVVPLQVTARDFYNEPLKSAPFQVSAANGNYTVFELRGKLEKNGIANVNLNLPKNILEDGIKVKVAVQQKQANETVEVYIPVQADPVDLNFYPEGGNLVHGTINRMSFKATDRSGNDFPFEGKVITPEGVELMTINSDKRGEGTFSFKPHANQPLKVIITSPYVVAREFDFPAVNTIGVTMMLAGEEKDSLQFRLLKNLTRSQNFSVAVIHQGKKNYFRQLSMAVGGRFKLPRYYLKPGINQITLFDSVMVPLSEHLFYEPLKRDQSIKVSIDNDKYLLREKINVTIDGPQEELFVTLKAVDEFRMDRAAVNQNIVSYLLVDSELDGQIIFDNEDLESPSIINHRLKYQSSINSWGDIFKTNGLNITYNTFTRNQATLSPYYLPCFRKSVNGMISCSNYDYNNYYAAINSALREKTGKPDEREPAYKEQLRNGVELRKVLYMIKPYQVMNNSIVFLGHQTSLMAQDGALIVIDGARAGTNINTLDNISPFNVDRIEVSTLPVDISKYTALNSVGIVEIYTIKGKKPEPETIDEEEFSAPVYDQDESRKAIKSKTDLRTTLQWIPFKTMKSPEEIAVYHSDLYSKVIGIVEGIDFQGNPFYRTFEYNSR